MLYDGKSQRFNKHKDVKEFAPGLCIDLGKALENGSVPSDLSFDDAQYNGIEDPESIMGRPGDVFEADRMRYTKSHYKAPEKAPELQTE